MKHFGFALQVDGKNFEYAGPVTLNNNTVWIFLFPRKKGRATVGYDIRYVESQAEFDKYVENNR